MSDYIISLKPDATQAETDAVDAALWEYNAEATADAPLPADLRRLTLLLRNADGEVVGGLRGDTHWGWLFIGKMAIRAEARGQGYGAQLLALAEEEARRRGCHHAYVDTMSFQAPGFYEKHGYKVFGVLEHCPGEHKHYYMQKPL
jgi:GNAT superfamily N-acetyltransferase